MPVSGSTNLKPTRTTSSRDQGAGANTGFRSSCDQSDGLLHRFPVDPSTTPNPVHTYVREEALWAIRLSALLRGRQPGPEGNPAVTPTGPPGISLTPNLKARLGHMLLNSSELRNSGQAGGFGSQLPISNKFP